MIELVEVGKIRKVTPDYGLISKEGCRRYTCQMNIDNSTHNFFVEFTVEVESTVSINPGDKAELRCAVDYECNPNGGSVKEYPYTSVIINDKKYKILGCEFILKDSEELLGGNR